MFCMFYGGQICYETLILKKYTFSCLIYIFDVICLLDVKSLFFLLLKSSFLFEFLLFPPLCTSSTPPPHFPRSCARVCAPFVLCLFALVLCCVCSVLRCFECKSQTKDGRIMGKRFPEEVPENEAR